MIKKTNASEPQIWTYNKNKIIASSGYATVVEVALQP